MKLLAKLSIALMAALFATQVRADGEHVVRCQSEIVDASTGEEALVCRQMIRTTDGTGKEIMIEDPAAQPDVGVAL